MRKDEFIDRTLTELFTSFMPPGMEKAKTKIEERQKPPEKLEEAAWQMYEVKEKDVPAIKRKVREAAKKTVFESAQLNSVELGLLAPAGSDYEIERTFRARSEEDALRNAVEWAESQGYTVEEPSGKGESVFDWRIDGRKLTQI